MSAVPTAELPVLSVRDLHTSVAGRSGRVEILRGVSFDVAAAQTLAVVGESGSGKSFTALTLAGLLPQGATVTAGQVLLGGRDVLQLDEADPAEAAWGEHRDGVPGSDDGAEPGHAHRKPGGRRVAGAWMG